MSDLEFSLPLPPEGNGEREAFYLNTCRVRALSSIEQLLPRSRQRWPTEDKVRCDVVIFITVRVDKPLEYLRKIINEIGGVLWGKESQPLIIVDQVIGTQDEISPRILVKVTRRKFVSEGAGRHYEW